MLGTPSAAVIFPVIMLYRPPRRRLFALSSKACVSSKVFKISSSPASDPNELLLQLPPSDIQKRATFVVL